MAADRFNHTKLSTWSELGASERSWVGQLARYVDDRELVKEWQYRDICMFFEVYSTDEAERCLVFLVESLLTMFASRTLRVRFRAMVQAATYLGKLQALQVGPLSLFLDAFRAAQYDLEQALGVQP
jgi:hypothetical protein